MWVENKSKEQTMWKSIETVVHKKETSRKIYKMPHCHICSS